MNYAVTFVKNSLLAVTLVALAGCAADPKTATVAAKTCSGNGTGLSAPPTPDTIAAMTAHEAAAKLSTDELIERVGRGDSAAQVELGIRYANGTGIEKNGERAFKLFETASGQGNILGRFFIGVSYSNGFGAPKDESIALVYFEDAARQGYSVAQYWLGFMVANGRGGVTPDWCAATPMLEAAALADVAQAALELGIMYQQGYTGVTDYQKAAYWYRKATSKTLNQMAQLNLRRLIESRLVEWQDGDPGKPVSDSEKSQAPMEMKLKFDDKSPESVGAIQPSDFLADQHTLG